MGAFDEALGMSATIIYCAIGLFAYRDDAQIGLERGERVVGDFGPRLRSRLTSEDLPALG